MSALPDPITAVAAPLVFDNIDTDTIIPSREMQSTGRTGLAEGLFAPWRYKDVEARIEDKDFTLNQAPYRNAQIIAVGRNFGCGSSREHAVWALAEYGVRVIIAESFAPIFRANCIRNFILPITLPRNLVERLARRQLSVSLAGQHVMADGATHKFEIEPEAKQMLEQGLDAIDLTLVQSAAIDEWIADDCKARPWVYLENTA